MTPWRGPTRTTSGTCGKRLQGLPFPEAIEEDARTVGKAWGREGHLYIELGLYAEQVGRYFDVFPQDRLKILMFNDLVRHPRSLLADVARFLAIDPGAVDRIDTREVFNSFAAPRHQPARRLMAAGGLRRMAQRVAPARVRSAISNRLLLRHEEKPVMDREVVARLRALYEPDLQLLEQRMGRTLPGLRGNIRET